MRKLSLIAFTAVVVSALGCGKDGPAEPAKLSAEQLEAAKQEEKKAADEERANQKADPSYKKGAASSVSEEERRARGGR